MASTRLNNDYGAQRKNTFEMSSQLGWVLDPHMNERADYTTCDEPYQCSKPKFTPIIPKYKSGSDIVDTESDLWGITRPLSSDPSRKYPYAGVQAKHQFEPLPEIGLDFSSRATHLDSQQPNRERGVFPERFFNPIVDLTRLSRNDDNSKIGFNTYLAETDTYKMFIPRPIDSTTTLPPRAAGGAGRNMLSDPFGPSAPRK